MTDVQQGTKPQDAVKPKKKRRILVPLMVLLVAAAGAAAAYNHFSPGGLTIVVGKEETGVKTAPQSTKSIDFGSTVVNLADNHGTRFLRVALVLEFPDTPGLDKEISEKQHRMRDGLVILLRQNSTADLRADGAVDQIREEIRAEINRHLEKGRVENVYFTEFIIQ
ncbi:MAG: flagellar basal body-associated FliL family protein [Candidatus Desulforudis sp.]|nr:flagellar basal body-associated FliL family protein [Desulforudis sp.]